MSSKDKIDEIDKIEIVDNDDHMSENIKRDAYSLLQKKKKGQLPTAVAITLLLAAELSRR